MENYTYKILSADPTTHTMIVEYIPDDSVLQSISLNIPAPDSLANIDEHVNTYAPQTTWYNIKNPNYDISSLSGIEKVIDPTQFVKQPTTIVNSQYEIMNKLNADFMAEQSNTGGV